MFLGSEELSARIGRCRFGDALLCQIHLQSSTRSRSRQQKATRQTEHKFLRDEVWPGWMIPTELFSGPSTDRWRQFRPSHFPRPGRRELTPNLSAFFFAEGCIFPFL